MVQEYQLFPLMEKKPTANLQQLDYETRQKIQRLLNIQKQGDDDIQQTTQDNWFYINPLSGFTLSWNILYMVVFYLAELQISVQLSIYPNDTEEMVSTQGYFYPVYISFLAFWCVDCILSFFKGYYVFGKAKIVTNLKLTALHYIKSQFIVDLIVILIYSIPLVYQSRGLNYLQIVTLLLLWVKKIKYSDQNEKILQYQTFFQTLFLLTSLFANALIISNFAGCIFLGMDLHLYNQSYYGQGTSSSYYWLTDNTDYGVSLIDGPWWTAYIWAQSYAAGTLSTLAPGPFPRNPWEALYVIIVMLIFVVFASYIADMLVDLSYIYFQRKWNHQEDILTFDNFMHVKQVTKDVRIKVSSYFELVWELQLQMESEEQQEMIDKLPYNLKEELLLEIGFTKYLHFTEHLPQEDRLKKLISLKLQRFTVDAHTCIIETTKVVERDQTKLYYIKQGMAMFYITQRNSCLEKSSVTQKNDKKEKILNLSNVQKILGIYQFLTGQNYSVCCKSIDLCLIQSLKWSDFWEIVIELEIQEQFHKMKHCVLYQRNLALIGKVCVVCLGQHIETQCPELFIKWKILKNTNFSKQQRSECKRIKKARKERKSNKTYTNPLKLGEFFIFQLLKKIESDVPLQTKILENNNFQIDEVTSFQKYFENYNLY